MRLALRSLAVISVINIHSAAESGCIIADAVCRSQLGFQSYCIPGGSHCHGAGGTAVTCTCGTLLSPRSLLDFDKLLVPGFPFISNNYPNMTIIPTGGVIVTTTTTDTPTTEILTTVAGSTTPTPTEGTGPTSATIRGASTPVATTSPPTTTRSTTTTTTTTTPTPADPSSMFLWAEWPSMTGESDWIDYFAKLVRFVTVSPLNFNKVITRVLDPIWGSTQVTVETTHDLWTVSTSSVFYTQFLARLPSTVTTFEVYPYLMDVNSQGKWMTAMGTSAPLEAVFKYCSLWNTLLATTQLTVRCGGVTVDGEEKRGYINEISNAPTYKSTYSVGQFAYATGYTQVGVIGLYAGSIDQFYFELYDFYVHKVAPAVLVQNSDVAVDDAAAFITELNENVWYHYLPFYEASNINFMWSIQDNANNDCLYPDGPTTCGIKQDFGVWSVSGFQSFISQLQAQFPTKFGNKPSGLFQFSFLPLSWYN